jgi:hypothetical protein
MRGFRGQPLKSTQNGIFAEKNGWKEQGILTNVKG